MFWNFGTAVTGQTDGHGMSEKDQEKQVHKGEEAGPTVRSPAKRREPKKDWLGDQLRELYQSYSEEPLPDELKDLLAKLGQPKESKDPNEGPA